MITIHIAVIKSLLNGGDGKFINNYRPISFLNNLFKILEKIIKSRLITFLDANKLLSVNQFGFIPGIDTGNALYKTTQFIYNELDNGNKVITIFLDLAKPLNTVNHSILLYILSIFSVLIILV